MLAKAEYCKMKKVWIILCIGIIMQDVQGRRELLHRIHNKSGSRKISLPSMDIGSSVRIVSEMKDKNATSGENVQFKCKIESRSNTNIQFTWYHNDKIIRPAKNNRISIISRPWGSKLRISSLYTFDSGIYRCEVSDGILADQSSAKLSVSFERPPPLNEMEKSSVKIPQGKCEKYQGSVCGGYFDEKKIFVDAFADQKEMESQIHIALKLLSRTNTISDQCQQYAIPAFCYYVFPQCEANAKNNMKNGRRLCREDCQILKNDICHTEYLQSKTHPLLKVLFETANCSFLPSHDDSACIQIGLPSSKNEETTPADDRGTVISNVNVTETGLPCVPWTQYYGDKYPQLTGHNFCQNPNKKFAKSWCFYKDASGLLKPAPCKISNQDVVESESKLISYALIASCLAVITLFLVVLVIMRCCYLQNGKSGESSNKNWPIIEVNESCLCLHTKIGTFNQGKICQGTIVNDSRFAEKQTFAFKCYELHHTKIYLEEFKREIEVLSKLNHPGITNLKGVCYGANLSCLIFEYSNQLNLHEYLRLHSKSASQHDNSNRDWKRISADDLVAMAIQIAEAMDYLNKNNYVLGDLSARNVLIFENMRVKICNLGAVMDSYTLISCSTSEEKLMPIRWMAPESLHSWKFSDKSTVWSFGVVLWEMFSYGLQPYCGYSNHEVLDMISRRQLLSCPDQCPAKMYSLMQECWAPEPIQRPQFKEIVKQLREFIAIGSITIIRSLPYEYGKSEVSSPVSSTPNNVSDYSNDISASHETSCLLYPEKRSEFYSS